MNARTLKAARDEAKRFIVLAGELLETSEPSWDIKAQRYMAQKWNGQPGKRSGAVRRASMDLTRALAEMRRP